MKRFLSLVLAAVLALCALPAMAESAAPTKLTVLTTSKDDLSADYSRKKVAGPRVPMPPPRRESTEPMPVSRGRLYFICASSTCNLPS